MPSVTIDHGGGSTETIDNTVAPGYKWERTVGEMFKLTIWVDRDDAQAVTLNRKSDEISLSGVVDNYPLVDINTGGPTWELICYSPEWYGKTVEPTAGGVKTTDTDDTQVTNFIGDVSEWSAGTVNQVASGSITLISSHAQPHERIRKLEQKTGGELRFNDDGTVDYTDRLGSDKSGSITLSPGNANLDGELTVENRGRTIDATHVKVLGAHEGEAQFFANLVPSSDGRSYDNKVTYSTSRWSDSSDDDWTTWANSEAASQSAVDAIANALADEITDQHIEASATVVGEDIILGDTVHVDKSKADIDRDMRIKRIVTKPPEDTPVGSVDRVLLSTRNLARDTSQQRERSVSRMPTVFEGNAVWGTIGGGYQAVTSSRNYVVGAIDYPTVDFEHEVTLWVKSVPYITYSSGASTTTVTETSDVVPNDGFGSLLFTSGGTETVASGTTEVVNSQSISKTLWPYIAQLSIGQVSGKTEDITNWEVNIRESTGNYLYEGIDASFVAADNTPMNFANGNTTIFDDLNGDTVDLRVNVETSSGSNTDIKWFWQMYGPSPHDHSLSFSHSHAPEAGVDEFSNTTPSNVDVLVNGNTEATDIGSGEFETTVDLTDALTKGQFNTVELSSDATGGMYATLSIDAYRQIGVT